jgi:hypothetical protein
VHDVAPSTPSAIATLVDRCLAKAPDDRSARDLPIAPLFESAVASLAQAEPEANDAPAVLSEREAQALWSRAAELQAMTGVAKPVRDARAFSPLSSRHEPPDERDRRTLTSGYRYADVLDAATEAGIPERYVARAAAELRLSSPNDSAPEDAPQEVIDGTPRASPWAGAPMSIQYEVQVPGEVPDSDLYVLVETIRQRMGEPGHVGTIGKSLSWSSSNKNRQLQISIIARHGKTTIRMDERLGQLAGALYGGIVGGGGGGSSGLTFGVGLGAMHSVALAFGVWGGVVAGTYVLARTIFKSRVRARRETLSALAHELANQVRDLTRVLPRVP